MAQALQRRVDSLARGVLTDSQDPADFAVMSPFKKPQPARLGGPLPMHTKKNPNGISALSGCPSAGYPGDKRNKYIFPLPFWEGARGWDSQTSPGNAGHSGPSTTCRAEVSGRRLDTSHSSKNSIALLPISKIITPMVSRVFSAALNGIEAFPVEVEVNSGWGDSVMVIVGLPDAAVKESRNRVSTALSNSGNRLFSGRAYRLHSASVILLPLTTL